MRQEIRYAADVQVPGEVRCLALQEHRSLQEKAEMTCPACEERRAKVFCDPCSLKGKHCQCGKPATQWVHVDRYVMQPCCDDKECLPYIEYEGKIFWKMRNQ